MSNRAMISSISANFDHPIIPLTNHYNSQSAESMLRFGWILLVGSADSYIFVIKNLQWTIIIIILKKDALYSVAFVTSI